jgi:hypothetical protein
VDRRISPCSQETTSSGITSTFRGLRPIVSRVEPFARTTRSQPVSSNSVIWPPTESITESGSSMACSLTHVRLTTPPGMGMQARNRLVDVFTEFVAFVPNDVHHLVETNLKAHRGI